MSELGFVSVTRSWDKPSPARVPSFDTLGLRVVASMGFDWVRFGQRVVVFEVQQTHSPMQAHVQICLRPQSVNSRCKPLITTRAFTPLKHTMRLRRMALWSETGRFFFLVCADDWVVVVGMMLTWRRMACD